MIQTEIPSDEVPIHVGELQLLLNLADLKDSVAHDAVPAFAPFVPRENLPTTERNIQVERASIKIQLLSSRNLSASGTSAGKPFLFRTSAMTFTASFSGTLSQRSRTDCQKALPEVADRNSCDNPNDSATGTIPEITANKPFCWNPETFPRLLPTILEHSPASSVGTEMTVL